MNNFQVLLISLMLTGIVSAPICGQTVDELMEMAVEHNPKLKALELEYEAALLKGPQVSQLPDPQIGIAVPAMRPETRLGAQALTVSATQMFPWFGSLKAKEEVVLTMAKAKFEALTAERLNLYYTIKVAYDQLWLLERQQQIIHNNIELYESLEKVSLSKVESGKARLSDVLRIQLMIRDLEQQLVMAENQKQKHYARINEVIDRPSEAPVNVVAPLDSALSLPADFAALEAKVEQNHPIVNQLQLAAEVSEREIEANRLSGRPAFGLGLDYGLVMPRTDMSPERNGRDILIPKVMISIPLSRKKYNAKHQEELILQDAYGFQKEAVVNGYVRKLHEYKADFEDALLRLELAGEQRKTTQSAIDILLSYYSSEGDRFEEVLQLYQQLFNYDLAAAGAIAQMHLSMAGIELLTDY